MEDPGGLGGPPTGSAWTKGTLGEIQNTRIKNTFFKNSTHTSTKTMKYTNNPGILFNHLQGALGQ